MQIKLYGVIIHESPPHMGLTSDNYNTSEILLTSVDTDWSKMIKLRDIER